MSIVNPIICDRCGKKCEGTTYYHINIWAEDIVPDPNGGVSTDTAAQNMQTNLDHIREVRRYYCQSCRNIILKCMYGG